MRKAARCARLGWLPALAVVVACDMLLTDPIQPVSTIELEFQVIGDQLGTTPEALAKVERVFLQFTVPDSVPRDTTVEVSPNDGAVRLGVQLRPEEHGEALDIYTRLATGADQWLFEGQAVVLIEPGTPTDAEIMLAAITDRIGGAPNPLVIPNIGETGQATNAVLYATGDTIPGLQGTWASLDPLIMTVTPTGLATGVAIGQTELEVQYDTLADTITAIVSSISTGVVTPAAATIFRGSTQQFSVEWRDALGNVLTDRAEVWSVSDATVASIDPATGLLTTITPGTVTVTATAEGVPASTQLAILEPVAQVIVTPDPATLVIGGMTQLTADPQDALSNSLFGRTVTWSTSDAAVATVDPSGLVTGVGAGAATVTATAEGIAGTSAVTVNNVLRITSTSLPAGTAGVDYGTLRLTAAGGAGGYSWSIISGSLPTGLSLATSGDITGAPTVVGTSNLIVGVTSGDAQSAQQALSITVGPGAPDAALSTVVVDQSTMIADGVDETTVTVTALDALGNPVPGQAVVLAVSGTGNTITQPGLTNASGVAVGSFMTTTDEAKTISATAGGVSVTETQAVTATPQLVDAALSTVVVDQSTMIADGVDVTTVTVTALDALGNPVPGQAVVLAVSGTGNTITQPGVTNASGVAMGSFMTTTDEAKTVSATAGGVSVTETQAVTATPQLVDAALSTVVVDQSTMIADGVDETTVTVTALDALGNPVPGQAVVLAVSGTGNTITQPGLTNASGVAVGSFMTTTDEAKTVSATAGGVSVTETQAVTATPQLVDAALSTVVVDQSTMIADGVDETTVTVTALDALGNPVPGQAVVLAVSGTGNTITQPGLTNASGVAMGSFMTTTDEAKTVSATAGGVSVTETQAVTATPPLVDAALSTVVVDQSTMIADGVDETTVTVTALDALGNPVPGQAVVLAVSGTGNTITQPGLTNASGVAVGSFMTTTDEAKTVSATAGGVSVTETQAVTATPQLVDAASSTVVVDQSTMIADGVDETTVTVTALDALGNPVPGQAVVLAVSGTGNTITQPGLTNASGVAMGSFMTTTDEAKTVSATAGGVSVTETQAVTATPPLADAALSTVVVDQSTMIADGVDETTVTVTALDALGNPVPGQAVVLAVSGTGNTITQPGLTNASGVAVGSFMTTTDEAKTVSATAGGVSVTETQAVTATPQLVDAALSTVVVDQSTMIADGVDETTVTVTALDALGSPVPGQAVVLAVSGTGNTITQPGLTNASGVAVGSFMTTTDEAKTISATAGGVSVTETQAVTATPPLVDAALSTLTVNQSTMSSNGTDAVTVFVTALDDLGDPSPGLPVVLSVSGTGNTISQPVALTDASGLATGTFTTTVPEAKTVSATVAGVAVTQTQQVTAVGSNLIPIADPGGSYRTEVGTSVLFDGSASTDAPPGVITNYEWIVDGVSVFSGAAPTFSYLCSVEGTFVVELIVTDNDGNTSTRTTGVTCEVTTFLGRWLDGAGNPITTALVGEVVELQLCFLEDDLTAFQSTVRPFNWAGAAQADSVVAFDNTAAGTHPDCAGTTDIVTEVTASSDLTTNFTVIALSTATGPGVGPQGIVSLFFTFLTPVLFDDAMHFGVFTSAVLDTFDGDPPPFVIDVPDLLVN